jgi:hypothetical protein
MAEAEIGTENADDAALLEAAGVDARGQISVELDGARFILRPSEEAIATIEQELNLSLEQLVAKCAYSQLNLQQCALIVTRMMQAYAKADPEASANYRGAKVETVRQHIFEAGVPKIRARLMPLLSGAMTGGYTASGELKATGTTN